DDPKAVRGGLKALIITQIGGVGLLVGALVARAQLGTYQISALFEGAGQLPAAALAVIAFSFLVAAAAKSAQFPFHTWLPDAMEAPTPISALIHAATMVNAGVYLIARFFPIFAGVPGWQVTVICMGLVSALVGAVQALTAWDLKRVLAYSTISQLGYLMYANGVGAVFESQFHLFSHALFKALLFLSAGAIIHALGSRDMREMRGLGAKMPFVRVVFLIGTLGLVGLPIANGFFSKDLILEAGLEHGPFWAYVGMLVGVGLTALYSARMLTLALFTPGESQKHLHDASAAMRVSLAVLALGTLTSWLLVGGFGGSLAATLPFHHLEAHALGAVIGGILGHLGTWIALACAAVGIGLWFLRARLAVPATLSDFLTRAGAQDFGLGWVNQAIVAGTTRAAEALRRTQTGYLNWNVFGILGALVIVLGLIFWGS
ncbi:MAG: hypothetical protein JW862_11685, partial [Anaerolineales bacterium]|nr:hypothetical protein [Anaerolineales bacterium]